jgi:hypothetical protein
MTDGIERRGLDFQLLWDDGRDEEAERAERARKRWMALIHPPRVITGDYDLGTVEAAQELAPEAGLTITVIASAGEDFEYNGATLRIREGRAFMKIENPWDERGVSDLTGFWDSIKAKIAEHAATKPQV